MSNTETRPKDTHLGMALDITRGKLPKNFMVRINMDCDFFSVFVVQYYTDILRYVGSGELLDLFKLLDSAVRVATDWEREEKPK